MRRRLAIALGVYPELVEGSFRGALRGARCAEVWRRVSPVRKGYANRGLMSVGKRLFPSKMKTPLLHCCNKCIRRFNLDCHPPTDRGSAQSRIPISDQSDASVKCLRYAQAEFICRRYSHFAYTQAPNPSLFQKIGFVGVVRVIDLDD